MGEDAVADQACDAAQEDAGCDEKGKLLRPAG
jgi:hypothetical protein